MSVRELVLLIFWGISCILITVQIIKIWKVLLKFYKNYQKKGKQFW